MSFLIFQYAGDSDSGLTKIWWVTNVGHAELGKISWYAPWRRYVYNCYVRIVLDAVCLREIADFCEDQTRRHNECLLETKKRNQTGIKGS